MFTRRTRKLASTLRSRPNRLEPRPLSCEQLENRSMMFAPIIWVNQHQFGEPFGPVNSALAINIIGEAISEWSRAIDSFNYRNIGSADWSKGFYELFVNVQNLNMNGNSSTLANATPHAVDGDGKPFGGHINIDVNAAGAGWFFDPTPGDDYEFKNPISLFTAGGGPDKQDLYSTVLHELGHALGLSSSFPDKLAIRNHISNNFLNFSDGTRAALTEDHAHTLASVHPNDLMNPDHAPNTRYHISDLDARILGEGFGYTINLQQVYDRAFVITHDPSTREMTVWGDLGKTFDPLHTADQITINSSGFDISVTVNGYTRKLPTFAVRSILVQAGRGNDMIRIESTQAGIMTSVNGGIGSNTVTLSPSLRNLNSIQGNIDVSEDGGVTTLSLNDDNNLARRIFSVNSKYVSFSESSAKVSYADSALTEKHTRRLVIRGGSGNNIFTVDTSSATKTYTRLLTGSGNDTVNIIGVSGQGMNIDGVSGVDNITVAGANGMNDIFGSLFIYNSKGFSKLVLDDSQDTRRSIITVRERSITGQATGSIEFDPLGIQSIDVLASTATNAQGNSVNVLNTPQNRANNLTLNLKTGKNRDFVRVNATASSLSINGENGRDQVIVGGTGRVIDMRGTVSVSNTAGRSELIIDNSRDTVSRSSLLQENSFSVDTVRINFVKNDLIQFKYFGGLQGIFIVDDTPQNVNLTAKTDLIFAAGIDNIFVRRTTSPLTINGGGGADQIIIGNDGKVGQINGPISINNPLADGLTSLTVDGANDVAARTVTLDSTSLRGLSPAEIRFQGLGLAGLTVSAGPAGNVFKVSNTPQNAARTVAVTLNTGKGVDTVNVNAISSDTTVNGQDGADTVNVGLAGNMQGIQSRLSITNFANRAKINLNNSADTQSRTVTMDVPSSASTAMGTVSGLAPGQIQYRQADVRSLSVWGGTGNNTFTIANTVSNGIDPITTVYAGSGADNIQVSGTTGRLFLQPQGNNNIITIGGTAGTLDRILGDIVLQGTKDITGNRLEIRDVSSAGRYAYSMDTQKIYRSNFGGSSPGGKIYTGAVPLSSVTLVGAPNGNGFQIFGTPIHPASQMVAPVTVMTGAGSDNVEVFGSTRPLSISLGTGVVQTVKFGDITRSLDALQAEVSISGSGYIDTFVTDAASTTARPIKIDSNPSGQTFERFGLDSTGLQTLKNTFKFAFSQQGRIQYQAGRALAGTNNLVEVLGVASNSEVIVNGGPAYDLFQVGSGDASKILGPVTINSPDPDNDFASYVDSNNPLSQEFLLKANPLNTSGIVLQRTGLSPLTFNGLISTNLLMPRVGGNKLNAQSSSPSTAVIIASDQDRIALGSSAPTTGGNLSSLGPFALQTYRPTDAVSLLLDDSGNNTVARDVTIEPYSNPGFGILSGFGFSTLTFPDTPNISFDLRGGGANDSFLMRGAPLSARFSIDGGAGNDILVSNGNNTLLGGSGRDLLVAGVRASVLNGGLDEDILIGGSIINSSLANLAGIRTIWAGSDDYQSRVTLLDANLLSSDKLSGNRQQDSLTGSTETRDLFFGDFESDGFPGDLLVDRNDSESFRPI